MTNGIKVLLQMQSGFLQLESTLGVEMRRERMNIGMRIGLECAGCVEKKRRR
jgi:hypothetical protein